MSNRKYPRLSDGYHERSPFHPHQASSKHSGKNHSNCITDGNRERDRSPANSSGFNSRDNSPYSTSSRHSNNSSPRSQRSKYSSQRARDGSKRGSSQSPIETNSARHGKFNHISEEFSWSQHVSSSGKIYYYNFKTEKSQWEKPKEWLERERREKEKQRQKQLAVLESKDRDTGKEQVISRETSYGKLNKYGTAKVFTKEHPGSDRLESSRMLLDERSKDNHHGSGFDRVHSVVKTSSAYTAAVSTASQRSTPVAANSSASPAGSVQDVSPPSTPSSRANMFDSRPHTASPQLITVSPHLSQYNTTQAQQLPGYGASSQTGYPTGAQQYTVSQTGYSQYGLVNNGNQLHTPPTQTAAQQQYKVSNDVPALHPLQQATLLHQRQLSESKRSSSGFPQQYTALSQSSVQTHVPLSTSALLKEDSRTHSSPGSPVIFAHGTSNPTSAKDQPYPALATLHTALSAHGHSQSPSALALLASQPSPINLQALTKYVDKNLTGHVSGWITEGAEKQIQRLSEEGSTNATDANKIVIEQFQFHSQLNLLELRLDVGTKRVSSLKGLTKTLEHLLAESDKKSLT